MKPTRAKAPKPRTIRSKIACVTHRNSNGTSRQRIIRKYCRAGMALEPIPELENLYSETAIGIWVRKGWIFKRLRQVGSIRSGLSEDLTDEFDDGKKPTARILEVTGGGWFKSPGVHIEITLETQR